MLGCTELSVTWEDFKRGDGGTAALDCPFEFPALLLEPRAVIPVGTQNLSDLVSALCLAREVGHGQVTSAPRDNLPRMFSWDV